MSKDKSHCGVSPEGALASFINETALQTLSSSQGGDSFGYGSSSPPTEMRRWNAKTEDSMFSTAPGLY